MKNMSLTEKFAMIGLKNQRSSQMTVAKKASIKCLAASVLLDRYIKVGNTNELFGAKKIVMNRI